MLCNLRVPTYLPSLPRNPRGHELKGSTCHQYEKGLPGRGIPTAPHRLLLPNRQVSPFLLLSFLSPPQFVYTGITVSQFI